MAASILTIKIGPTTNSTQAGPNAGIAVRALKGAGARGLRGDTGIAKLRAWINTSKLKLVTFANRTYVANQNALDVVVSSWCEANTGQVTQFLRECSAMTPDMTFIHARGPTEFGIMQEDDREVDVKATMQMSESAGKVVVVYVPGPALSAPAPLATPQIPPWAQELAQELKQNTEANAAIAVKDAFEAERKRKQELELLQNEVRTAAARERGNKQSIEEVLEAVQITRNGFGTWA